MAKYKHQEVTVEAEFEFDESDIIEALSEGDLDLGEIIGGLCDHHALDLVRANDPEDIDDWADRLTELANELRLQNRKLAETIMDRRGA